MKKTLVLSLLILLFTNTYAEDAPLKNMWQKANSFYTQKAYDSAAYYLEQIAAEQPRNAEVYYNLGNAYYRLNQIGPAVLNYERALFYKPSYTEAKENLYLTQGRISNRIPEIKDIFFVKWWNTLTTPAYANFWAILSLLIFLAIIGTIILKRLGKMNAFPIQVGWFAAVLWILTLVIAITSSQKRYNSSKAVVMEEGTVFAMQPNGKSQSLIPEGTTVKLENEQTGWLEVKLPDGRTGWMPKESLVKI